MGCNRLIHLMHDNVIFLQTSRSQFSSQCATKPILFFCSLYLIICNCSPILFNTAPFVALQFHLSPSILLNSHIFIAQKFQNIYCKCSRFRSIEQDTSGLRDSSFLVELFPYHYYSWFNFICASYTFCKLSEVFELFFLICDCYSQHH